MAKKLYKESNNKRYKIVQEISKYVSKNGKIKCKDKKKKKTMKKGCVHVYYNNKGKLKGKASPNGDGTATCLICGARYRIKPYTYDELLDKTEPVIDAADQMGYVAARYGFDPDTIDFISKFKVMLYKFPKLGKKITSVAMKKTTINKKKKKKNNRNNQYGSWSTVKRI